ncbi:MAG TPA: D-aminoacylase [Armatimonadota bacterium]|jgi:N-acyl-D-amino-acid deacylase
MTDLIIRNAAILDGSGAPRARGDVAVTDGKITAVGTADGPARRTLDADGLCLAPGFIDMHSHSDHFLLVNPTSESKVTQGVTLEVCGNCGSSSAPLVAPAEREAAFGFLAKNGVSAQWSSVGELMSTLDDAGMAVNFMTFVGHGTVRASVVGYDARPASEAEMTEMRALVARSMDEGAVGLASGLIYAPGCFGGTAEVTELCKPVGAVGGLYSTHMRNEGDTLLEAVEESIAISEQSGARLQISHHKSCGPANWGKVRDSLRMIEDARGRGLDVAADQYPYIATCTSLDVNLPQWAHDGGRERMAARLSDPGLLPRMREETVAHVERGHTDPMQGWRNVVVSNVDTVANKWTEGLSVAAIAEQMGLPPFEAMVRLLIDERCEVGMIHFAMCEEDVETVMASPNVMFGSDATSRGLTGPLAHGKPHPRTFGTMPRVLAHYVRERGVIALEEAVRKMTSLPASRLRLADRGRIAPGFAADLVLFDADSVRDAATFADPFRLAEGIPYVFTNGVAVVDDGRVTGNLPGRCLRPGRAA